MEAGTSGFLSISDSVRKVPRVVTGESGIILCGGMELRLLLELFTAGEEPKLWIFLPSLEKTLELGG